MTNYLVQNLTTIILLLTSRISGFTDNERFELGVKHSANYDRRGNIIGPDSFCQDTCWSLEHCNQLFPSNKIDLQMKIDYSKWNGPGQHLVFGVNLGDTIARQSFDTQFVLDLSTTLNVSNCQLYVTDVVPGSTHHSHKSNNVIVKFRFFPANSERVMELTRQVTDPDSDLYNGFVTRMVDPLYSLVATHWDATLKLSYNIDVVDFQTLDTSGELLSECHKFYKTNPLTKRRVSFLPAQYKFQPPPLLE